MSQKNDFDYLKEKFDADGLSAPESLSAEEMKKKIMKTEPNTTEIRKPRRRYAWGSLGAAAACVVALVVVGNTVISPLGGFFSGGEAAQYGDIAAGHSQDDASGGTGEGANSANGAAAGTTESETGMMVFSDYAELENQVSRLVPEEEEVYDYETYDYETNAGPGIFAGKGAAESEIQEDMAAAPAAEASGEASAAMADEGYDGASSDTYVQVKGVDEADIIKTDDNYIYYLDRYAESIFIAEAHEGKATMVGQIEVLADASQIDEFYLYDDTLVTLGSDWEEKTDRTTTVVVIYDISDRTSPVKVNEYRQSGYMISSRMVENNLYLVTDYYFYYYGGDRYIPYVTGQNGYDRMDIADICAFPENLQPEYVIAGSVDVTSGKQLKTKAKAILGASQDIYCNTENLYVAGYQYGTSWNDYDEDDVYILDDGTEISGGDVIEDAEIPEETMPELQQEGTRILKAELNDGEIRFTASGMVTGRIDNQFSMDEKDGYLRIATTSMTANGYDTNNLFVLDENLKTVGSVTGFAKDEHVEAVRYIGDKAYVITYEQTDPLFVIDVSDPTEPKIEGSVKIDGFSTLLVPADESTLFGIGYATSLTRFGEAQSGLKLVSFDISNPSVPRVADAKEFMHAESEVQYNHKALVKNATDDYYAIPYNQYDRDGYYFEHAGVLVVRIKNGHIQIVKDYQGLTNVTIRRCVYIGDYIYMLDNNDEISSFRM